MDSVAGIPLKANKRNNIELCWITPMSYGCTGSPELEFLLPCYSCYDKKK